MVLSVLSLVGRKRMTDIEEEWTSSVFNKKTISTFSADINPVV